jgi:hypothetical protein
MLGSAAVTAPVSGRRAKCSSPAPRSPHAISATAAAPRRSALNGRGNEEGVIWDSREDAFA